MSPTRQRKTPEARRRQIQEAVIRVGTESGMDGITVRDVAEAAGVAPGLIHHYFPSTDDLLAESFGAWADASLRQLTDLPEGVPPTVALALVVANLTPDQRLWHDALSSASRYDKLRERALELSVNYQGHVESVIRAGVEDGSFTCADPESSTWRIILILDGLVPMVHILGLIDRERIPELVGAVVEQELSLAPGSFAAVVKVLGDRAADASL